MRASPMPAPASVRIGPAEIALTRMRLRRNRPRDSAPTLQRRLGRTHGVVVRHRAQAAVIGQRDHGAAVRHQCGGARAASVKAKHEISMVRRKFSRVVSA
jgi:hypothetical protein